MILPEYILPQNISILWSRRGDQLDLNTLMGQIPIQTPSILLVSGKSENQDVVFGLFEPKEPEDKSIQPFMVQLAPIHRVFRPLRRTTECSCSILLDQARGSPTLTCQLFQSEQCIDLVVSGNCHGAAVGRWSFARIAGIACFGCFLSFAWIKQRRHKKATLPVFSASSLSSPCLIFSLIAT